jgi:hypothetical protein
VGTWIGPDGRAREHSAQRAGGAEEHVAPEPIGPAVESPVDPIGVHDGTAPLLDSS